MLFGYSKMIYHFFYKDCSQGSEPSNTGVKEKKFKKKIDTEKISRPFLPVPTVIKASGGRNISVKTTYAKEKKTNKQTNKQKNQNKLNDV